MARTKRPDNTELTLPETIRFQKATQKLLDRAEAYGKKAGLTSQQVSKKVFGHHDRIDALNTGRSFLAPDTYEKALRELKALERSGRRPAKVEQGVAA